METAILSFIGLIVGATLQYFFTRHIENQRHIRDLRSKAYMDFMQTVCELANMRPKEGSKERNELAQRTADAKARICLYGSSETIQAYSKWEQLGPNMGSEEQRNAFIEMVKLMRADSGSDIKVDSKDLKNVLLGVN